MEHEIDIKGILEFAINIEQESSEFYQDAISRNLLEEGNKAHNDILKLLESLVLEEIKHKSRLQKKLDELTDPGKKVEKDKVQPSMDKIVNVPPIKEDATIKEILETALVRENNTMGLYASLTALSDLGEAFEIFEELVNQEKGHASRINSQLKLLNL